MKSLRSLSFLAALAAPLLLASTASAQECTSDVDCGSGEICSFDECPPAVPCDPDDMDCPEPEPCTGFCADPEPWETGCETDADCADGYECVSMGAMDCADAACPPGEDCPEVPCESEEFAYCAPALDACESDADCDEGLVCYRDSYEVCMGGGMVPPCEPGEDCPDPEPFEDECETIEETFCAPAWIGECSEDADCGEGFTCEAAEICECTGTATPDGEPAEEDCTCYDSEEMYCAPLIVECAADADCGAGFECTSTEEFADGLCEYDPSACTDGEAPASICLPENFEYWADAVGGGGGVSGGSVSSEDDLASGGPERVDGDSARGSSNQAGTDEGGASDDGGCSAAPSSPAPAGALLLGALGLLAVRRRR